MKESDKLAESVSKLLEDLAKDGVAISSFAETWQALENYRSAELQIAFDDLTLDGLAQEHANNFYDDHDSEPHKAAVRAFKTGYHWKPRFQ